MTNATARKATPDLEADDPAPTVDIVVPVLNQGLTVTRCLAELTELLQNQTDYEARIIVVDRGSTDGTWQRVQEAERQTDLITARRVSARGPGHTLSQAWGESSADLLVHVGADLSADLRALPPLLDAVNGGGADLAVGSRLAPGAVGHPRRSAEAIARGRRLVWQMALGSRYPDAKCDLLAARSEVVQLIAPAVQDQKWFFDTELLVRAQWAGFAVAEIPIRWTGRPKSGMGPGPSTLDNLQGASRLALAATWETIRPRRAPRPGTGGLEKWAPGPKADLQVLVLERNSVAQSTARLHSPQDR